MKLTKEDIDKVRDIEGFPIGTDEDIIALSSPPFYTACPNPFIEDFIKKHSTPYDEETDEYKREPFAADVSEGKNDPIYNAHSYHTKVPHKAVMRYILHYTEPGDMVFDGFCGTGMAGVAAQMCGNPESDLDFKYTIEKEMPNVEWGTRKAILNDLSPAATFIANNYNASVDVEEFEKEANTILDKCEKELGWMYETNHLDESGKQVYDNRDPVKGSINYTVWSDVFICTNCGNELVYWDVAVDIKVGEVKNKFLCKNCNMELQIRNCERAIELLFDCNINKTIKIAKQVPVLINYKVGKKRYNKSPDLGDFEIIDRIDNADIDYWYPIDELPDGYNTEQPKRSHGIDRVHLFYTKRTLNILSKINNMVKSSGNVNSLVLITSILNRNAYKGNRFVINKHNPNGRINGPKTGTLYLPPLVVEQNIIELVSYKLNSLKNMFFSKTNSNIITTQSTTKMNQIPNSTIDYIFTDPPFGGNINYSELSFLWESWIKVKTNNQLEAVVNKVQAKGLYEYQELMTGCFEEYYRVLKPNRWMTVEFHNSKNSVWNSIQEALIKSGFIVADVRILDKINASIHQQASKNSVKQDLIISVYKPKESFKKQMIAKAGTEETAWDFVREHLNKLPVVVEKDNKIEIVTERQAFLLFDRMVAYHIMAGIAIPIDAPDFYKGLDERFLERDNMYFLHDQINEYDNARIVSELEPIQFSMFVNDEKNAIAWLYYQLEEPQTYGEIQPKFMKEAKVAKHEKLPELGRLLEENFLQNDEGQWYIPDPTRAGDIIKLREKRLIKEFDEYLEGKGKLRQFRTEAVRVGFAKLYKNRDYENIVKVGNRLPEKIIQEDDKLLMYYDMALSRVE